MVSLCMFVCMCAYMCVGAKGFYWCLPLSSTHTLLLGTRPPTEQELISCSIISGQWAPGIFQFATNLWSWDQRRRTLCSAFVWILWICTRVLMHFIGGAIFPAPYLRHPVTELLAIIVFNNKIKCWFLSHSGISEMVLKVALRALGWLRSKCISPCSASQLINSYD